eukprot:4394350-Pyramimonas_sp.AAC.1
MADHPAGVHHGSILVSSQLGTASKRSRPWACVNHFSSCASCCGCACSVFRCALPGGGARSAPCPT